MPINKMAFSAEKIKCKNTNTSPFSTSLNSTWQSNQQRNGAHVWIHQQVKVRHLRTNVKSISSKKTST